MRHHYLLYLKLLSLDMEILWFQIFVHILRRYGLLNMMVVAQMMFWSFQQRKVSTQSICIMF